MAASADAQTSDAARVCLITRPSRCRDSGHDTADPIQASCIARNGRLEALNRCRVFYDATETQVQVLAVVTKADAQAWLDEQGTPTANKPESGRSREDQG